MPGRGRKPRWTEADISTVEQWLAEERSYSSSQLSEKLAQERGVQLGARRLGRAGWKCGAARLNRM
jgi:transposase